MLQLSFTKQIQVLLLTTICLLSYEMLYMSCYCQSLNDFMEISARLAPTFHDIRPVYSATPMNQRGETD